MNTLLQDIRHCWRSLAKEPGFVILAIFTLGLGIGGTTSIYSVLNDVLLRPLPYRDPERIVLVTETLPLMTSDEIGVSAAEYQDYREQNHSFVAVAAYESAGFNLTGTRQPSRVKAARVSASAFTLLGVPPQLGRVFGPEEDTFASEKVVVISDSLWKREYGREVSVIGKKVKLDQTPYTIVGVMPESFSFPFDDAPLAGRADLWVPEAFDPQRLQDRVTEFGVGLIARLKPGVTIQQARGDIESVANRFTRQYSGEYVGNARVLPRISGFASRSVEKARPLVWLLSMGVGCVLLIACANVANLSLARATRREQEMAIRSAIGASPARILRQCLTESLVLSLAGACVAVAVAELLVIGLRHFGPQELPRLHEVGLRPMALLFTLGLAVVVAVVFGFAPAWRLSTVAPHCALKEGAQLGTARSTQKLQNLIAAIEIAVAVVLLMCAGLLLKSFVNVMKAPTGFDPNGVFLVRTLFDDARYPESLKRQELQKELLARLQSLPGVTAVAVASHLPLIDSRLIGFRLEHATPSEFHWTQNSFVSPGYFRAMGITLLNGRDFREEDQSNAPMVAVVSDTMAKKYFPNQSAVGQRFYWGDLLFTIIGIAADVRISALDADPPPIVYNSMFQVDNSVGARTAFVLRADRTAERLFEAVEKQIWSADRDLPVYNATSLANIISESLAQRRFTISLLGGFAVLALAMAAVGLFGVISYFVAQRTREFGIRIALGATKTAIYWLVWKRAAAIAVLGSAAGLGISMAVSRLFEANLFQVSRFDLPTLILVPFLLVAVTLFAAFWPARSACAVDPLMALRHQ